MAIRPGIFCRNRCLWTTRTYTKRLANKTIQEVLDSDIHSVASKGIVTTEEIERMLKDASESLPNLKPLNLKRLGLDEIALIKGKGNYCAVLVDLDTSKLIAVLSDVYDGLRLRTQDVIKKTLMEWGIELLGQIEEVSIDLWRGYKTLVTELMPNAQVVADRFHVMTQINKELDTQRRREKRSVEDLIKRAKSGEQKAEYEQILLGLKNSKYPLLTALPAAMRYILKAESYARRGARRKTVLHNSGKRCKNQDNLNEEQLNKLIQLKNVSPILKVMHELKEKIRKIFNKTNDWYTGVFKLGMWLSRAKKYFPNSNNTLTGRQRWLGYR